MPDDPTLAEVFREVQRLVKQVEDLVREVRSDYVRKDVLDAQLDAVRDDVKGHSEWITWATRIVLALVITAVVGYALTNGGR